MIVISKTTRALSRQHGARLRVSGMFLWPSTRWLCLHVDLECGMLLLVLVVLLRVLLCSHVRLSACHFAPHIRVVCAYNTSGCGNANVLLRTNILNEKAGSRACRERPTMERGGRGGWELGCARTKGETSCHQHQ